VPLRVTPPVAPLSRRACRGVKRKAARRPPPWARVASVPRRWAPRWSAPRRRGAQATAARPEALAREGRQRPAGGSRSRGLLTGVFAGFAARTPEHSGWQLREPSHSRGVPVGAW